MNPPEGGGIRHERGSTFSSLTRDPRSYPASPSPSSRLSREAAHGRGFARPSRAETRWVLEGDGRGVSGKEGDDDRTERERRG